MPSTPTSVTSPRSVVFSLPFDRRNEDDAELIPVTPSVYQKSEGRAASSFGKHETVEKIHGLLPLVILPAKVRNKHDPAERVDEWLPEEKMGTEYLGLFYDIVAVAVLTTFTARHELTSASAIPTFLSFYVVFWWMWMSQISYDMRFGAEDTYHRLIKLVHVLLFVLVGASSAGWSPLKIQKLDDVLDPVASEHYSANLSFTAVVVAYLISRFVLALQYVALLFMARGANRPYRPLIAPLIGQMTSMILLGVAIGLHSASHSDAITKLILLYLAVASEMFAELVNTMVPTFFRPPASRASDRMSALTLIILGEGFIGVLKSFNNAFNAISVHLWAIYLHSFCTTAVLFFIWFLLFQGFDKEQWMGKFRTILWVGCHYLLHFTLLLMIAAMVNRINGLAFSQVAEFVLDNSSVMYNAIQNGINPQNDTRLDFNNLAIQLNKLPLVISLADELEMATDAVEQYKEHGIVLDNINLSVEYIQWQGEILLKLAETYNLIENTNIEEIYEELSNMNTTYRIEDEHLLEEYGAEAFQLLINLGDAISTATLKATIWLFPTAGGTLILAGVLGLIRFQGRAKTLQFNAYITMSLGVVLALLGLLAIGPQTVTTFASVTNKYGDIVFTDTNQSPLALLEQKKWAIPIITIVYALTATSNQVFLWVVRRRQGGSDIEQLRIISRTISRSELSLDEYARKEALD